MSDKRTIAVYDKMVEEYGAITAANEPDPAHFAFIKLLPKNGFVLDLGCGPARSSAEFVKAGMRVDPVDASIEMVKLANKTHSVGARQATFDEISGTNIYDGIWASFSLLHAPESAFPGHLNALKQALKPGGWFHIAMKLGTGEERDSISRQYSYYSEAELTRHLKNAGFEVVEVTTGESAGLSGEVAPWVALLTQG